MYPYLIRCYYKLYITSTHLSVYAFAAFDDVCMFLVFYYYD